MKISIYDPVAVRPQRSTKSVINLETAPDAIAYIVQFFLGDGAFAVSSIWNRKRHTHS